jgi:carboxylesterase type B
MPSSVGLFSKAIMQSFPVGLPFRNSKDAPSFTKFVAKDSGCPEVPYEDCMRKLTWQEVLAGAVKAETSIIANANSFLSLFQPFSPTIETPELSKQPMQGFLDGTSIDVHIMIGSVRQEGMIFLYEAFKKGLKRAEEDGLLALIYGIQNVGKVLQQYPRTGDKKGDMRNHTAPIVTDSLFKCPIRHIILQMLKNQSTTSKIYNYHFDHVLSFGNKFWLPSSPICLNTVCHGDELPILFRPNITIINGVYTKKEIQLSTEMQTYWGNFAKKGVPGSSSVSNNIKWIEFNTMNESAMKFSTTNEGIINHQYTEICEFWDSLGYPWILK